jgi:hypothetical protein
VATRLPSGLFSHVNASLGRTPPSPLFDHGHPDGTEAGARAVRAAVEAAVDGESLESRAEDVSALATALEKCGTATPR